MITSLHGAATARRKQQPLGSPSACLLPGTGGRLVAPGASLRTPDKQESATRITVHQPALHCFRDGHLAVSDGAPRSARFAGSAIGFTTSTTSGPAAETRLPRLTGLREEWLKVVRERQSGSGRRLLRRLVRRCPARRPRLLRMSPRSVGDGARIRRLAGHHCLLRSRSMCRRPTSLVVRRNAVIRSSSSIVNRLESFECQSAASGPQMRSAES
jgi:hypothetical protein